MIDGLSPRIPPRFAQRLSVPIIAAPMMNISGPALVSAACRNGAIGSFPTFNARTAEILADWLERINAEIAGSPKPCAPLCPNIVVRSSRAADDVAAIVRAGCEMVITSVGSPAPLMPALKDAGVFVMADVASLKHAEKAVAAGVDGLVLLTGGSGGKTGWLNPFAFVRALREWYDGLIVLAGGMSDGFALRAAVTLGADMGYVGTRFIAARESMANDDYRQMLVSSTADDILLTSGLTSLPANFLRPSIVAAGISEDSLDEAISEQEAAAMFGGGSSGKRRWRDIWSAGHSVSGVRKIETAGDIIRSYASEFAGASSQ